MILDTSALVAMAFREPDHDRLLDKFERFLQQFEVEEIPFTEAHWRIATDAFLRFGKGRHPAALNFGDCMTYATAKLAGEPLLFVGNDFAQTDLPRA